MSESEEKPSAQESSSAKPPKKEAQGQPPQTTVVIGFRPPNAGPVSVGEMEFAFRRSCPEGDDRITWRELGLAMLSIGKYGTAEQFQQMIKSVDSDGDGYISLEEFIELNNKGINNDTSDVFRNNCNTYNNGPFSSSEGLLSAIGNLGQTTTADDCWRILTGLDNEGGSE